MTERFYWFGLAVLGVWRITHLLSSEDGPWNLFARLRRRLDGSFWAGLLDCFYCLSVWVSAPFAFWAGANLKERVLLWPALSAAAILIERATARLEQGPPAEYFEHGGEQDHVVLR
jgi:hypothetical protein